MQHISVEQKLFSDDESLYSTLKAFADQADGKLTIMAGHFMLVYRPRSERLAPLLMPLAEEADAEKSELERAKSVSDFPEASLRIGIRVLSEGPDRDRKIALLVNDHQFQTFQQDIIPGGSDLARLKSDYFRSSQALPTTLRAVLEEFGVGTDIFERNDARRANATLPSETFCFSENALRGNFEKRRKDWILTKPGFRRRAGGFTGNQVVYHPSNSPSSVCLLDEQAGCACNGAMTEFLLVLAEKGARSLIVFVPDECRRQVDESIRATMEGLINFDGIIAVWGNEVSDGTPTEFQEATLYRRTHDQCSRHDDTDA